MSCWKMRQPFGMPEHRARRLFLEVEQVEILADAPVVALLGLFEAVQVFREILVVEPGGAVDALEHLVARIAAPVGAGHLHQLEGLELAGGRHVRTAAQVEPLALAVQARSPRSTGMLAMISAL